MCKGPRLETLPRVTVLLQEACMLSRVIALVLGLAAACNSPPATDSSQQIALPKSVAPEESRDLAGYAHDAAAAPALALNTASVPDSAAGLILIRTGDMSIEVDSLEAAVARAMGLARRAGGHIADTRWVGGEGQMREATLQLRVPAGQFELVSSQLDSIGRVEWLNVSVQDVGEEFVDLNARVGNQRRLESRLIDLLATRTGKLEDVLAVERELARVREQIELIEGRLRYLRSRAAMSTLTVRLHERGPVIGGAGGRGAIAEALRQAWRNFVAFTALLISGSGVLIPLVTIGAAVILGIRWWRRRP